MNITANGNYEITPKNHRFSSGTVYVSGIFGTSTIVINIDNNGTLTPLSSGALVVDEQYTINHGHMAKLVAVVSGSDVSTSIDVDYNGMS